MSSGSDSGELLIAREVAALLKIKVSTVYAAAGAGRLPSVTLWRGRRKSLLRFRRADIEALIAGKAGAHLESRARR